MMKICILLLAIIFIGAYSEVCTDTELVFNGDFSKPEIFTPWTDLGYLPGGPGTWSTLPPQNGFELWKQGAEGSPVESANGLPTGQNLAINGNEPWAAISYEVQTPCLLGDTEATFYFEYWFNPGCGCDELGFSIEQKGEKVVSESYEGSSSDGWKNATGSFMVMACQPIKLTFTSNANGNAGVHINNVSLKVKECCGVEMVSGGSFEVPAIIGDWDSVSSIVSGEGVWYTTSSSYTLWKAGAMGSPTTDAVGKAVGQFLELNAASTKAQVGYKFFTPFLLGTAKATITFQYWIKQAAAECSCNNLNYFGYSVEQGGKLLKNVGLVSTAAGWEAVSVTLDLKPALPAHIYFTVDTNAIGGVFIDAVSVTICEVRDAVADVREDSDASALEFKPANF